MTQPQLLVFKLLQYFKNKQDKESEEYKYYTNTQDDSNVTDFESLSNANVLVLHSCLQPKYIGVLMNIFQAIWDDNYWYFQQADTTSVNKFFEYANENYDLQDYKITEGMQMYGENGRINNIAVYNECPPINHNFIDDGDDNCEQTKKHQTQLYTIEDILALQRTTLKHKFDFKSIIIQGTRYAVMRQELHKYKQNSNFKMCLYDVHNYDENTKQFSVVKNKPVATLQTNIINRITF